MLKKYLAKTPKKSNFKVNGQKKNRPKTHNNLKPVMIGQMSS